jgi:hypothetical protein
VNGSWDENKGEEVSCCKYSKIRMLINIDDGFRG